MASTQKKTTNSKKKTEETKTEKKTAAKADEGKKSRKKEPKPLIYQPNMVARGIGAGVCVFVAVMLILSVCGTSAVVVDFLSGGVKGLLGYGIYPAIPALLLAAGFLLFKRERPLTLRLWDLGLLVLFVSAALHMILSPYDYEVGLSTIPKLWGDGRNLFSGGVLGGGMSVTFITWFGKAGADIILALFILCLIAGTFRLTPAWFMRQMKKRRERDDEYYDGYDYDEGYEELYDMPDDLPPIYEEAEIQPVPERSFLNRKGETRRKPVIDLPLDEPAKKEPSVRGKRPEPPREATREEKAASLLKSGKDALFNRKSRVKRPDEVLDELAVEDEITFDNPVVPPAPAPVSVTPPAAEPAPGKAPTRAQQKQEIQQEAEAVSQAVEQSMEAAHAAYIYPPLDLLEEPRGDVAKAAHEELEGTLSRLSRILTSFGVDGRVIGAVQGPSVTRYDVELEQGVRLNKLTNLSDDVALALGVSNVRIAPVPDQVCVVGIEVPNKNVTPVSIREVLSSPEFRRHKSSAAFSVGKDIGGNFIVGDCAKLPHLLIAGTTGSGKSVCINSLIISMLYKSTPEELKLIMVDPKMVELGGYNGIPHLLIPVVTDPKKAAGALQWAVTEMMKRYRLFAEAGVRELNGYNQWAKGQEHAEPLPKVVIVIDELADLMLVAAKEVEESICRVAQMGRASGMHLVIATQRPSADVITGLMKANIPSRIAFAVASSLESRIILDNTGAEKLVGKGDMLWFPLGSGKPRRVQGCFISDEEVASVVACVKQNSVAEYDNDVMQQIEQNVSDSEKKGKGSSSGGYPGGEGSGEDQDEMFPAAVEVILELGQASVSMLQRRLKLGYSRAARLVDQMEQQGIVGPFEGSKPRQLLITREQWQQMQNGGESAAIDSNPPVEEELLSYEAVPQTFEQE